MPDNTIRDMLATSSGWIHVTCGMCQRSVEYDVSTWNPDLRIPDLKRFFRCSKCGEKATQTMPTWKGFTAPGMGGHPKL